MTTGKVTRGDRALAWNKLRQAAKEKKTRPFYRAVNKHGLMYAGKTFKLKNIKSFSQLNLVI